MYDFKSKQTFTKSETAPFKYDLFDIMEQPEIGAIIKTDRGKEYKVVQCKTFSAYYDTDSYYKVDYSEGFRGIYGKCCLVVLREYYPKNSFAAAVYRLQYVRYTIRTA